MKVLKFGGTSVGTPQNIHAVCDIIRNTIMHENAAVIVSAFSGVTDTLLEISERAITRDARYIEQLQKLGQRHFDAVISLVTTSRQEETLEIVRGFLKELEDILHGVFLLQECTSQTRDTIMSFGERLSAYIITRAAQSRSIPVEFLDTRTLIKTDENFGNAHMIKKVTYENINRHFQIQKPTQIATGFIAETLEGATTTLGRGGSDYTASIIGAAIDAEVIEIWTDVDGVMTADPRLVPDAHIISHMTYEEAMEMSYFGAKVIYPSTMQPALEKNIPIKIKNTFKPEKEGTIIQNDGKETSTLIKGISSIPNITLLRLQGSGMIGTPGIAHRLFSSLAHENINIILITQASSEHSICFAVLPQDGERAKQRIQKEFALEMGAKLIDPIIIEREKSIIAVVGEKMRNVPGISGKLFSALGEAKINVIAIAQGSSELNISVVINNFDEKNALICLHRAFFSQTQEVSGKSLESEDTTLKLYLLGTGNIGKKLMEIIAEKNSSFNNEQHIRIAALADSSKMIFDKESIHDLNTHGSPMNLKFFMEEIKKRKTYNDILVDCTDSNDTARYFVDLLRSGISIVTPNKKTITGEYENFEQLMKAEKISKAHFLYETTVGAALPILSTLKDLLNTNDSIINVEAVLSGTLSYVFNNFTGKTKFSELVWSAREKGYTEPDPREDFTGIDVTRKILILARHLGYKLELSDIYLEPILPEACLRTPSVDAFFDELRRYDSFLEEKKYYAESQDKHLCYIASIRSGVVSASLQFIDQKHPFFHLSGNDNVVAFSTKRYKETPLVIQGPGSGATVTAAGILSDILKTSHRKHTQESIVNEAQRERKKIPVGILGATGIVGQNYVQLLAHHPWFQVAFLAASPRSAGMKYEEAVKGRWHMESPIPINVRHLIVQDASSTLSVKDKCKLVFSALEMEKEDIKNLENAYGQSGIPVISNASAHRETEDVPMLIPEINSDHLKMISFQQKERSWKTGFIIVKPNCSVQSYLTPLYALLRAGYEIRRMVITTLQALSGAGYPGIPSLDIVDNILPYIEGEEDKSEREPRKILGTIADGKLIPNENIIISAQCTRVPVVDGHMVCASIEFGESKPSKQEILKIWNEFRSTPQELSLPSAPEQPIICHEEDNRPQPRRDRWNGKGMAVTVGRLRPCEVFDYKFVALSHNTVRGAAGGGILNAELLVAKGLIE